MVSVLASRLQQPHCPATIAMAQMGIGGAWDRWAWRRRARDRWGVGGACTVAVAITHDLSLCSCLLSQQYTQLQYRELQREGRGWREAGREGRGQREAGRERGK